MAWREYVDPTTNEWWTTDDLGNFLPGRNASIWNPTPAAINPSPVANTQATPSWNQAGGYGQWNDYMSNLQSADQRQYLIDRLNQLEIPMSEAERQQLIARLTGYYRMGAPSPSMTNEQALDYIWQARPDLAGFYRGAGWAVDTPEQRRAAVQNWITSADPQWRGMTAQAVAERLGATTSGGGGFTGTMPGEGALPTFEREQFREGQRQFNVGFLGSKSGPRDWLTYRQLQPTAAFGTMTPTPSWEQALVNYWTGGQGGAEAPAFQQPKDTTPAQWQQLGPSGQEMRRGEWSYWGIDPQDAERMMRAAWPTGTAAPNTTYR